MSFYHLFHGLAHDNEYNAKTSLSLALACQLAYEDDQEIRRTVNGWGFEFVGFKVVQKNPDIDTQCFVMSDSGNVVVVFRGSDSPMDWLANFQTVYDPGPFKETKAHEGFQDALFPSVISITNMIDISLHNDNSKKIWVTGHSLGGALCSLYSGMLIEHGYNVFGIYTFASPRPADGEFARKLNERMTGPHFRVVNSGDVVPHVPPEPFYCHSGQRVILKEKEIVDSDDSWFEQRVQALKVFVASTVNKLDIGDNHRLSADGESYIPRLIKDLERPEAGSGVA